MRDMEGTIIMMTRRAACWLLLVALASALIGCGGRPQLRVMTYNIHHGAGMDGVLDLERIAAVIRRAEPDLVALQEVDRGTARSGGADQAAELARMTGMQHVYGAAMPYDGGEYGLAILSRPNVLESTVHRLPHSEGHEPRIALEATVPFDSEVLSFVCVHYQHDSAEDRRQQAMAVASIEREPSDLVIIAGDFNARLDEPPVMITSVFMESATGDDPIPTWPADTPTEAIDHVLVGRLGRMETTQVEVIEEPVASDHRPLVVTVRRAW
jgi:endonuclease/exonuclease/phosphatase family metal-dependent hydrolase